MDDPNQIEVPPSFVALFTSPSGHRLLEPMRTVRERYELCEDLAQMLAEQASTTLFKTGLAEAAVLRTMKDGLSGAESPVRPPEASWVVTRVAEIVGWRVPEDL